MKPTYIEWQITGHQGFIWTLEQDGPAVSPQDLVANAGLNRVLSWNPYNPANTGNGITGTTVSEDIAQMNIEEHIQYRNNKIANAKVDNPNAWHGKTLEQLQDHVASLSLPENRNTDVYITLYDSYGDGHDNDAYILVEDFDGYYDFWIDDVGYDIYYTMSGGWYGYESAYGPV